MNRDEYDNTIRDLLGVDARPAADFPEDDRANVFDNNAALQTLTPTRIEGYLRAAETLVALVLAQRPPQVISCWPGPEGLAAGEGPRCARQILSALVARAYRRPPSAEETESVHAVYAANEAAGFEAALGAALEAVLVAPQFLFRRLGPLPGEGPRPLDDHELASRLSYFLWRTMPDAGLRALADAGTLRQGDTLARETRRLLADPRALALGRVLTTQWLALRGLAGAAPSKERYAAYYADDLRPAMEQETTLFVEALLRRGGVIADLVRAPWSFVDAKLARHYGLPMPAAAGSVQIDLGSHGRRGVLTQGSVLTMNSHPDHTSIVKRGHWVQSALLCTPLPDPPANVSQVLPKGTSPRGQRERLAEHRRNGECRPCHELIDPPGLALEGFDVLGRPRTRDEQELPIDTSGALADGQSFAGVSELAELIVDDERFGACVSSTLMTYALGRELDAGAACAAEAVAKATPVRARSFADLIVALVASPPFQGQAGEEVP